MKNVSVFLRRFLLLVFYANISTTSSFHLEEGKQPKIMSPVARERWSGPSRTQGQAELTISGRKHSDVTQGDLLPMTSSLRLKPRRLVRREDEDYQRDQGKEDDEGEEEEDKDEDEDEDEDRQSQTDSRHHFSRECRKQLNLDIESCLSGYESMLRNVNPKDQLNESFKLELCHEYEKTMQCLHLSFALCRPGHLHLQLIAYRLGYLRTFMEQTCDQLDKADGTDESEEVAVEDDESDSPPPPPPQPTNAYLTQVVTANRVPMERQDVGGATTRAISSVAKLRNDVTTSIVVPSDSSKPKTLIEPSSSSSVSSSASSSHSTKLRVTSSSAHQSVAFDATSSRPRMTSEHVLNGGGTECSGAFPCGGRAPDVDGQQRLRLQNSSLQHPTTTSSTILASIFPVVRSTLPSRYNGGLTPDPAATVALQSPFHPSSSRGEIIQAGALATASSSFGGTKPTQCHPEVTCSRANSMGYGSRSYSLDLCLVLSAILLLKHRVNIYH